VPPKTAQAMEVQTKMDVMASSRLSMATVLQKVIGIVKYFMKRSKLKGA
jgi:hypothetical protein